MTAMNICNRRRLASDAYTPPFVRRKQRIMELLNKYQRPCTEPEFFTAMFTDVKPAGQPTDESNFGNPSNITVKQPQATTT